MLARILVTLYLYGVTAVTAADNVGRIDRGRYTMLRGLQGNSFTYDEARKACENIRGKTLVSITTEAKHKEIETMVTSLDFVRRDQLFWTSGSFLRGEDKLIFKWANGKRLSGHESYWSPGQPYLAGGTQTCVTITLHDHGVLGMDAHSCDSGVFGALCEDKTTQTIMTDSGGRVTVTSGESYNYIEAKKACEDQGKQLISIPNESKWKEVEFILASLDIRTNENQEDYRPVFWTSGNSLLEPKTMKHVWGNGERLSNNESYWCPGEPNNVDQECITINIFGNGQFGLDDYFCDGRYGGFKTPPIIGVFCEDKGVTRTRFGNYTVVKGDPKNYHEAKLACEADNLRLAEFETTEQLHKVQKDFVDKHAYDSKKFWIANRQNDILPWSDKASHEVKSVGCSSHAWLSKVFMPSIKVNCSSRQDYICEDIEDDYLLGNVTISVATEPPAYYECHNCQCRRL